MENKNLVTLSAFFSILQDKEKYTFCIIDIFDEVIQKKTAKEIEEALKDIDLNIIELRFEHNQIFMYLEHYGSIDRKYL